MRGALILLIGALPAGAVKNALLRGFGWRIGRRVRVHPCLFLRVEEVELEDGASIGLGNVFRGLRQLSMGEHASIGQWNWLSASPAFRGEVDRRFAIGEHSAVTSRHYLDCAGGIRIGRFTTIAGVRSTFITHGIDWRLGKQRARGIAVGDYVLMSSNTAVTPGTLVGDRIVTGMGATLAGHLTSTGQLYVEERAVAVRDVDGAYFSRTAGYVGVPEEAEQ